MKSRGIRREKAEEAAKAAFSEADESDILPDCPADRVCCTSCHAYRDGKCAALADVHFADNICPFYKERELARQQRIAGMEKLEVAGRDDLIRKYYRNRNRYNKILAGEMVGIGYGFDDDGCANPGKRTYRYSGGSNRAENT